MANGRFALTTHCPLGHPYDEANTHINKKGKRICRACNALRVAKVYENETSEQREARRLRTKAYYEKTKAANAGKIRLYNIAHKDEKREYDRQRRLRLKNVNV
jgi:hypothetical protein